MFLEAETRFVARNEWSGAVWDGTHDTHTGKAAHLHYSSEDLYGILTPVQGPLR
jgi:hypothetical protein